MSTPSASARAPESRAAPPPARGLAAAIFFTALAALVLAGALSRLPSADAWASLTPGDCAEYCEASHRCGPLATRDAVQQPLNAWSNLAYLFVGVLGAAAFPTPLGLAFAAAATVLAFGSFGFHATVTRELQWWDMVGTVGVLFAVSARSVHAAFGVSQARALAGWAAATSLYAVFKWQLPATPVMAAGILVAAVAIVRLVREGRTPARLGVAALLAFVAAWALRELDVRKIGCDPASVLYQGHALWHLLTAGSVLAAWRALDVAPSDTSR